ncbi:MAG: RNA 2',3'-cyclic phosphodiesterase [Proteobacteria bacterium]|nr:RNA 2',3'-cyclic phosphodiesterase [Pseudomonadota bacterium]
MSAGRGGARRLFFALWPSPQDCAALVRGFAAALAGAGGRRVPAHNLHLTLEFLGSVPDTALPELAAIGAAAVLPAESVVLDRLEWWRRAAVLVAAAGATPPGLAAFAANLRRSLSERGFRVDSRAFRPHVTLVRDVRAAPAAVAAAPVEWPVEALALVESVPEPGGSRYVPLARWQRAPGA